MVVKKKTTGKKPSGTTVRKTVKKSKASTTRTSTGANRASFSQCNGVREIRHNRAPIGRPPTDPESRRRYDHLKREDTTYENNLKAKKEKRAAKRADERVKKKEAQAKKRSARARKPKEQTEADRKHAAKGREIYEREEAMKVYQGWSIGELRSEAFDHGIVDDRRDWKKMSRQQLAVWLYKHRGNASRAYYDVRW